MKFKVYLQFFSEEIGEPGVESLEGDVPAAEEQTEPIEGTQTEGEPQPPQNNFEKAFAKRLSAEREKWETEFNQKLDQYRDYDDLKKITEYVQRTSGYDDVLTLKEQIELTELQERAAQHNVPPEVMQRLEQLEQRASQADQYEQQQQLQKDLESLQNYVETFSKDKGIESQQLVQYMVENNLNNFDVAYKAMRADQLEQQLENAKKQAIQEYLESKKAPRVEGTGSAGVQTEPPTTDFKVARERAIARLRAANNPQ